VEIRLMKPCRNASASASSSFGMRSSIAIGPGRHASHVNQKWRMETAARMIARNAMAMAGPGIAAPAISAVPMVAGCGSSRPTAQPRTASSARLITIPGTHVSARCQRAG
jgi:hypothetical protein